MLPEDEQTSLIAEELLQQCRVGHLNSEESGLFSAALLCADFADLY